MGHYEVAPYFLKDEHARVPELQLASEAAMEKLAELAGAREKCDAPECNPFGCKKARDAHEL